MPLDLSWPSIAYRLFLATACSLLIGLNRDEKGQPAGIRTTVLVCLAATLAMLQMNLLLDMTGKTPSSFAELDLMRLPLGILSGIGFIGAGVIIKRDGQVASGVTTAATLWYVTVLGLLFGGGQCALGLIGAGLAVAVLWGLKMIERRIPRDHRATLRLSLGEGAPAEEQLRRRFTEMSYSVKRWRAQYDDSAMLVGLECVLRWREPSTREPQTPSVIRDLGRLEGVRSLEWEEG